MKNITAKGLHIKLVKHCFLSALSFIWAEEEKNSVNMSIFCTLDNLYQLIQIFPNFLLLQV